MVNAVTFTRNSPAERRLDQYDGDDRTVSDLLVDRVEFADVLLLNKTDLGSPAERDLLVATLRRLDPAADVLTASFSQVPLRRVFGIGRHDPLRAQQAPAELNGDHAPQTGEYGFAGVVFRATRAPDPVPLLVTTRLGSGELGPVLRSKGFFTVRRGQARSGCGHRPARWPASSRGA